MQRAVGQLDCQDSVSQKVSLEHTENFPNKFSRTSTREYIKSSANFLMCLFLVFHLMLPRGLSTQHC